MLKPEKKETFMKQKNFLFLCAYVFILFFLVLI